jgi:hypothetical protein
MQTEVVKIVLKLGQEQAASFNVDDSNMDEAEKLNFLALCSIAVSLQRIADSLERN